jgi:hypothetical protein
MSLGKKNAKIPREKKEKITQSISNKGKAVRA